MVLPYQFLVLLKHQTFQANLSIILMSPSLKLLQNMSVNSRLKATKIIGQRKAFYGQIIPESSSARKETVDIIDILVTSRNGHRKIQVSLT